MDHTALSTSKSADKGYHMHVLCMHMARVTDSVRIRG